MRYIVSACLAGVACRYDGGTTPHPVVQAMVERGEALPVCPEVLGGLSVPRDACERRGEAVLTASGRDCTPAFLEGARQALELARAHGCCAAILKSRSPSCGVGRIYDGSFEHRLVDGDGVFAALLRREGWPLCSEEDLPNALLEGGIDDAKNDT